MRANIILLLHLTLLYDICFKLKQVLGQKQIL